MKKPVNMAAYRKALSDKQDLVQLRERRIVQLENDLAASRRRVELFEEANENLRKSHAEKSNELVKAYRDRDDWRDAFRLIMRLVK